MTEQTLAKTTPKTSPAILAREQLRLYHANGNSKASPLVLKRSAIHESGCYTTLKLKRGAFVAEYTGPRLTVAEGNRIYKKATRTYLFGLTSGKHVIDGDSVAAFINHSCDPNCEADEINGRVIITTIRKVKAGQELTYDYNLYDGELDDESLCQCGAKNCRGSMYSEQELKKRKRLAKKAKKKNQKKH